MSNSWSANQRKFQEWLALPTYARQPRTQALLAGELKLAEATLSRWKHEDGWQEAVNEIARGYLGDHVPEVYGALVKNAEAGSIQHIRTYLELIGELSQLGTEDNAIVFRVVRE